MLGVLTKAQTKRDGSLSLSLKKKTYGSINAIEALRGNHIMKLIQLSRELNQSIIDL